MTAPGSGSQLELPTKAGILLWLVVSALAGAALVVLVILPAEYNVDPTGFGGLTGLIQLSEQPPGAAGGDAAGAGLFVPGRTYQTAFRSDEVTIPLEGDGELEYKVTMQGGATLVYSFSTDTGGLVYYDFHGHPPDDPEKSQSYGVGLAGELHGSLIAPVTGIHGWYLQNQQGDRIVVTLRMSGFYELVESQP